MTDLILTINAGSSSIKFSAFAVEPEKLTQLAVGLIDGIGAKAHFFARKTGEDKHEFPLDESHGPVDHRCALGAVLDWLEKEEAGARVIGVGWKSLRGSKDRK